MEKGSNDGTPCPQSLCYPHVSNLTKQAMSPWGMPNGVFTKSP